MRRLEWRYRAVVRLPSGYFKHTYHSVRSNARYLDWQNQPNPFRSYSDVPIIVLPTEPDFPSVETFAAMAALAGGKIILMKMRSDNLDTAKMANKYCWTWPGRSSLLRHSMAVSAWCAPGAGGRYSLRVNPSSGNLHPTEIAYRRAARICGHRGRAYHYRADRHALELRARGAWTRFAGALEIPWVAESQLIVGLTSIFGEGWKYGERAYRYCCHDLGHAMMSAARLRRKRWIAGRRRGAFCRRAFVSSAGAERKRRSSHGVSRFSGARKFKCTSRRLCVECRGNRK